MEAIGTLAGGIAHDFNNILFPIMGYAEMLLDDAPEDSFLQKGLNKIYTGALRAKELVKQILTFSRQETSELQLIKIKPVITEALKLIRSSIPTSIDINRELIEDCGVIKADPTQIHQIVMNLATNAFHAMEGTTGELKISLKEVVLSKEEIDNPDMQSGVYACFSVSDTGVGIPPELAEKIFDPFFTTKEKGKGTGMGLSVVHGIINSMGGQIKVHSEPGIGTEFQIFLPVVMDSSEKPAITAKNSLQRGNERIMLVDDEKSIITMEQQLLERLGYQVRAYTDSRDALNYFSKNPDKVDIVITDLAMPNIPGDILAMEMIKIRPEIPVLLCTGFSETLSEETITGMGVKGFLAKPIEMKDLAQKIRCLLDKKPAPVHVP
jgi:CheY-like chemotaxis protein